MAQQFDHLGSGIFSPRNIGARVPKLGFFLRSDGSLGFAIAGVIVMTLSPGGAWIPKPPSQTSGATTQMGAGQFEVIKLAAGSAAVILPVSPVAGQEARVGDARGDLVYNTIGMTVTAGANSGLGTINGQAAHVFYAARQHTTYRYNGQEWNIVSMS